MYAAGLSQGDAYIDKIESTIKDFLPDDYKTEAEMREDSSQVSTITPNNNSES